MPRLKRLLALAAVGVISVAGVACGGGDDSGVTEQDQQPADDGGTGDDGGGLDY